LIESLDEQDHSHFAFGGLPMSRAKTTPALEPAPAPVKPLPRVAADEHGKLVMDLQAGASSH
jgi:hypothetical protein